MPERYRPARTLGQRTALAKDSWLDRWVVLQSASTDGERTLGQMRSDFRCTLFDLTATGDLVIEYCPWPTLADYLEHPRLDPIWVRAVASNLVRAVNECHTSGWLHGDLNPTNVLASEAGEIRLIDFGASVTPGQHARQWHPHWSAPEQLSGRPIGTPSDVYSLGRLLSALAGRTRGFSRAWQATLVMAQHRDPDRRPLISTLTPRLQARPQAWPALLLLLALPAWAPEHALTLRETIRLSAGAEQRLVPVDATPANRSRLASIDTKHPAPADPPPARVSANPTADRRLAPITPPTPASTRSTGQTAVTASNTDS